MTMTTRKTRQRWETRIEQHRRSTTTTTTICFYSTIVIFLVFVCIHLSSYMKWGQFKSNTFNTTTGIGNMKLLQSKAIDTNENEQQHQLLLFQTHRETVNGHDVIWTSPTSSSSSDEKQYTGILFVAHGCHHSHTDFFMADNNVLHKDQGNGFTCPDCLGLPEELAIVEMAVTRFRLVVVAMSSSNRVSGCWSEEVDSSIVASVLLTFQDRLTNNSNKQKLPIYAFGASSGGYFVSQLGQALTNVGTKLDGYISQIAAAPPGINASPTDTSKELLKCAVYITMNRDTRIEAVATSVVDKLKSQSIPVKHIRLPPIPMSESFFSNRTLTISTDVSKRLYESFVEKHIIAKATANDDDSDFSSGLQKDNYYIVENPRRSHWKSIAAPIVPFDSLEPDKSPLCEIMNVAYAQHEMSRDGVEDALQFCFQQQQEKQP